MFFPNKKVASKLKWMVIMLLAVAIGNMVAIILNESSNLSYRMLGTRILKLSPTNMTRSQDLNPNPGGNMKNLSQVISWINYLAADEREAILQELGLQLGTQASAVNYSHQHGESLGHIGPTILPPRTWVKYTNTWEGMTLPVLTIKPIGRFGNNMAEYATLYALHKIYNVSAVLHPWLKQELYCFINLTLPDLPQPYNESDWTEVSNIGTLYNYAPIELAAAGLLGPKLFLLRKAPLEIQLFHAVREDIIQQFVFSPEIQKEAKDHIKKIIESLNMTDSSSSNNIYKIEDSSSKQKNKSITVIGFHIRRTEYAGYIRGKFGGVLPEAPYFNNALDYYRKKHKHPIFIVASDDYDYVKRNLDHHKDVFLAPGSSRCVDMATMSMARDSIVTTGSFGFWGAYLAGGEIVIPDIKFSKMIHRFSRVTYERIGLDFMTALPVT